MAAELSDPFAAGLAARAPELLREFNRAGVLDAADVQVARTLGSLSGVADEEVLLAVAMAVRAPRLGHVFVDLADAAATVVQEPVAEAEQPLPMPAFPEASRWLAALADCEALVQSEPAIDGGGPDGEIARPRPLRLAGSRLYLSRYWQEERLLVAALTEFSDAPLKQVELGRVAALLQTLFPDPEDRLQRAAAAAATLRGLTVIAGGPGTGKTTTIARLVAALCERAASAGEPPPLIGLCAPTGKAAARLTEAIQSAAVDLEVGESTRATMSSLGATTIHRLLGWLPGGRFRHTASSRLPHDIVIVDETSMVPLSLMVRLVQAVRRDARLVLVGDPDQLTAIEAGAVLRDIVGPAAAELRLSAAFGPVLERATGDRWEQAMGERSFGDGVVTLRRGHRFGAGIGALADAIRTGDADAALSAARGAPDEVLWYPLSEAAAAEGPAPDELAELRDVARAAYGEVVSAARAGDGAGALAALDGFRLLCAHRRGPHGVTRWTAWVEGLLSESTPGFDPSAHSYAGRPLLITGNDHELRLNNGDTGVVVEGLGAVFERDGALITLAPSRLEAVETLYAMTVHKSQGSQFEVAALILPDPSSRVLTRELLYTAVTRARRRLILVGSEAALRAGVARPVSRATGLRDLLWRERG